MLRKAESYRYIKVSLSNSRSVINGVLWCVLRTYLQTLGGALTGPSVEEAGGSAGGRHKPWWASTKSGAGVAIFGKGCDPIVGRCVVGAGGRAGPESGGREVKPVEPFLGATGAGCLWSSLPRL